MIFPLGVRLKAGTARIVEVGEAVSLERDQEPLFPDRGRSKVEWEWEPPDNRSFGKSAAIPAISIGRARLNAKADNMRVRGGIGPSSPILVGLHCRGRRPPRRTWRTAAVRRTGLRRSACDGDSWNVFLLQRQEKIQTAPCLG
jgi:hypothetical protein